MKLAWLTLRLALMSMPAAAGCGRVGFGIDDARDAATDAKATDALALHPDASPQLTWVGPFVQGSFGGNGSDYVVQAKHAGDAIVMQAGCYGNGPAALSVSAPGWTFTTLDSPTGTGTAWGATIVAIAPDSVSTTVTIAWTGVSCFDGALVGDELTNNDPAGGDTTFDGHAITIGSTSECTASVMTGHANDLVWAACSPDDVVSAVGTGYMKGADDGDGDWSELKSTTDPAGTLETATFTHMASMNYEMSIVTIKPAS